MIALVLTTAVFIELCGNDSFGLSFTFPAQERSKSGLCDLAVAEPMETESDPSQEIMSILRDDFPRTQVDDRDWSTVTASLFLADSSLGDAQIGMNEKHGLSCVTTADALNSSAYIELGFMGSTVTVAANTTLADLR